jgi:hypothetical protein
MKKQLKIKALACSRKDTFGRRLWLIEFWDYGGYRAQYSRTTRKSLLSCNIKNIKIQKEFK